MKKNHSIFAIVLVLILGLASCEPKNNDNTSLVTFEDVTLDSLGIWNGSDLSGEAKTEESWGDTITNHYGSFHSGNCSFANVYTAEWASWKGFACSNNTDTVTTGYANQYSVQAAEGAVGSKQFAVAFDKDATLSINGGGANVQSVALANSAYVYRTLAYQENGGKKFVDGDYFKVIITGHSGEKVTGEVSYYLADFRNGKTFINDSWATVDLTSLGHVDALSFTFETTDTNENGPLTPSYVCLDNLLLEFPAE